MSVGANRKRQIAIIGGGLGGLTAALAFARLGAQVRVYEQAPQISEVGAGIQITPNGARVLDALGLAEVSDRIGLAAQAVEPMDGLTGKQITRFDLTGLNGPPYRFYHRADLIQMLVEACISAGVDVQTNTRVDHITDQGRLQVGDQVYEPDLLIGADGLHSLVRPVLNGKDTPFFTGQVAWRAVIDRPDAQPVARIWMAPGRHVVTYPMRGGRMNIVAVQERSEWSAEGWHHAADPAVLRNAFAGFSPRVLGLFNGVTDVREWGLFRHPVAANWVGQNTAILGDAAHPTLPFLAQGANLAIEDAWALASSCDKGDITAALARYQVTRRPRAIRAIEAANQNASRYHLDGMKRQIAHNVLKTMGAIAPGYWLNRMDWLYGHDVTTE